MPKRILMLGARGFLGSHLLVYLESKGFDVLGCTEDIRNRDLIEPYFKNADIVINAAGETKKIKDRNACHTTNVLGTKNIIYLCLENNCKLIHLSSTSRKMAYGKSKQASQQDVQDAFTNLGLRAIILRLCPIVTLDDPLMVWGRRYPLEDLLRDIEKIIEKHDFNKFKLIDYQKFKHSQYEESSNLHKPRT